MNCVFEFSRFEFTSFRNCACRVLNRVFEHFFAFLDLILGHFGRASRRDRGLVQMLTYKTRFGPCATAADSPVLHCPRNSLPDALPPFLDVRNPFPARYTSQLVFRHFLFTHIDQIWHILHPGSFAFTLHTLRHPK